MTAPATFSRLMRKVLNGLQNVGNFIDDILIYTRTLDHHFVVLKEVLRRLREASLTAKRSKCSIAYSSLNCLGHIVGDEQLKPDSEKVTVIKQAQYQLPRNFLILWGLFYCKIVPNFAHIALPLIDLTKKGSPTKLA